MDRYVPVLIPLARCVAGAFGSACEVVVHDLSDVEHSVVFIANGHVTGRRVGDGVTNLLLETLRQGLTEDALYNYETHTDDGRSLRSTSVFIRGPKGKPIGAFCINFDTTKLEPALNFLAELTRKEPISPGEEFTGSVTEVLHGLLGQAEAHVGRPVAQMQREDKLRAVEFLEAKGAFLIRRAVERTATFLDLSRYTIYAYLDQIRARAAAPNATTRTNGRRNRT